MSLHHLGRPDEALHGWRELAGEVGIIGIGVLIALGSQQFVETAQEKHEAKEAEEVIRGEIAANIGRVQLRIQTRPCVDRRISEMQTILNSAIVQPNIVTPNWIGRPIYSTFLRNRWDAESQAGRVALINPESLSGYAVMYAQMRDLENEMMAEQTDWAKLRTLEHLRRLDQPALFELNVTLQDARYRTWRITLLATRLFELAKKLEFANFKSYPASRAVCLPITTTREAANRASVFRFGEP